MRRFLSLAFVGCVVASSFAQFGARPTSRMNMSLAEAGSGYLIFPSVQKELRLSPAVSKKIAQNYQAMVDKMYTMMSKKSDDGKKPNAETFKTINATQTNTLALLTPAQKNRLKQITLQQLGARGMVHSEVKGTLKLNADQERKIEVIIRDGTQMMRAGLQKAPDKQGDPTKRLQDLQAKQKEWRSKMTALALKQLTPGQRTQWQGMVGKPFELDITGAMPGMFSKFPRPGKPK